MKENLRIKSKLSRIVRNGAELENLFEACEWAVSVAGRQGGVTVLDTLGSFLDMPLGNEAHGNILDAINALTGQCHPSCRIGTGDYDDTSISEYEEAVAIPNHRSSYLIN